MPRSVEGNITIPATCPKRLPRIQSMKAACQCELHTPLQKHTLTNLVSALHFIIKYLRKRNVYSQSLSLDIRDLLAEAQHPVRICISEKFHDLIKLFFPFDKICEIHISEVSKGDAGQAIGLCDLFQSGIQCGKRLDFSIWTKAQGAFFGQSGIFQNNALIQISPVPDLIK